MLSAPHVSWDYAFTVRRWRLLFFLFVPAEALLNQTGAVIMRAGDTEMSRACRDLLLCSTPCRQPAIFNNAVIFPFCRLPFFNFYFSVVFYLGFCCCLIEFDKGLIMCLIKMKMSIQTEINIEHKD